MSKQTKQRRKRQAEIEATRKNGHSIDEMDIKNPTDSIGGKILIAVIALGMVGASIVAIIYAIANRAI